MADVGVVTAQLILETGRWNQSINRAQNDLRQTGRVAQGVSEDLNKVSTAGFALGAAVTTALGASVTAAANFQASMASVKAITNANEIEFANLNETAKELAASSVFGADQVSQAMYNLGSAGYDANKIIETMPGLLNLAAAAQTDLGTAAEITTSIMSGFGIEASRAAEVADILAQAANSSNSSIPDLGEAMKYVGPVAKTLGLSLEQTAAAVGLLSNVGIKGSEAGTALRASLLALIGPADQSQKLMDSLGISVTNAEGKMKSLPELLGHFGEKLKGMTDAQKTATVSQLVGTEAASGFLSLIAGGPQQLSDFEKALKNSGGTAQRVAETQMDTLKGKVEELKGSLENVGIEIGEDFLPLLSDFAKSAAEVIGGLDDMEMANIKGALSFGGTTAAVALLASGLGKLVLSARALFTAMGPAGWLISGISILSGVIAGAVVKNRELDESMLDNIQTQIKEQQTLEASIKQYDVLRNKSKLTSDEFARFVDINSELSKTADPEVIARLNAEQQKLSEKSGLSNDELQKMVGLNGDLIKKVPEATKTITDQGNAILENTNKLKQYSAEKLKSLYSDLELEKVKNETKYRDLLIQENDLIEQRKTQEEEYESLISKRDKAKAKALEEERKLNAMLADSEKYSQAALQTQIEKNAAAQKALELYQKQLETQATSRQQTEKDLEKTREKLQKIEEVHNQMKAIVLQQAGLNSEVGKEVETIDSAIAKLKSQKAALEASTPVAQRNKAEYQDTVEAINQQIGRLETAKSRVNEITDAAQALNAELGKQIRKEVLIRTVGNESIKRMPDLEYHTGGITGRGQMPMLHTGGLASKFADMPSHNEVDVRLLRNEMVLTEAQQANLMRMIDAGVTGAAGNSEMKDIQTHALLKELIRRVDTGLNGTVVMDSREVGRLVEPHVTEQQRYKEDEDRRFRGR